MLCLWYNDTTHMPLVTIGPDWCFSVFKILLSTAPAVYNIFWAFHYGYGWITLAVSVVFTVEMIAFLITVGLNPGLASRDISIH